MSSQEAELLYCRYHEDLCVYAYLQHEDGEKFLQLTKTWAILNSR